jgi:hypothetical protein
MKTFAIIFCILIYPAYFIMMLPIEYPLWQTFKEEKYNVPNYWKFFWRRCVIMKEQNYIKDAIYDRNEQ